MGRMRGSLSVAAERLIKLGPPLLQALLRGRDRADDDNVATLDVDLVRPLADRVRDCRRSPQQLGRRTQLHRRDEVGAETIASIQETSGRGPVQPRPQCPKVALA